MLYILVPLVFVLAFLRFRWLEGAFYQYSLSTKLKENYLSTKHQYKKIFFFARFLILLVLAFLIAKPQLVDPRSNAMVEGIDIMIVLDASGSMQFCDYGKNDQTRFDIAKQEAIRFIKKRDNDPIGLVVFGKDAISRCPLTLDKNILINIVEDMKVGVIDPDGTVLATAVLTAANRLKNSKAKSKIMILLTDGEPSQDKVDPEVASEVAKKLGIKIYTMGIGSDKTQYFMHPLYGVTPMPKINKQLLSKIARQTGGTFFLAKNNKDMRFVYDTIDKLEKVEYKTDIYSRYFDTFMPFLWGIFVLFLFVILFSTFIWFGI